MKGSKSKGKTATNARPPLARAPPQRSLPKRRGRGKAKVPQRKAIEVSVNYLRCKVVFALNELDPVLAKGIFLDFNFSKCKLSQYSILQQLKLRRHKRIEMTYKHTIDTSEALSLWNHLKKRRRGKTDEMQQLKELVDIIESYRYEGKSKKPRLEAKRKKINEKVEQLRRKVKGRYVQIRESLKANFQTSEEYKQAQQLQNQIRRKGIQLLDLTIVAIREISEDRVEILFQQSYPEKTCPRSFLKKVLGEKLYIEKKINFVRYYRQARICQKLNNNFIVCHICKEPLMENYLRCRNTADRIFTPSTYNSPNLFQRHLLAFDYCLHSVSELTDEQLGKEMDYFKYYPAQHLNLNCNRFLCGKCSQQCVIIQNMKDIYEYTCAYCLGECSCRSCELANEMVQILAEYKNILQRNFQPLDKYYQLIYFVNLDDDKDVEVNKRNRCTFQADTKKCYHSYYFSLMDDFTKINKVMRKIQDEAVRSLSISNDIKMVISQYMAQVRKYVFPVKKTEKQIPQPVNGKTLSMVRKYNMLYQKQQRFLKKRFQTQKELELDQEQDYDEEDDYKRETEFKNKLIKCIQATSIANRYQVPVQTYKISEEEWFMTSQQREQIKKQLASKLTPANPVTLSKSYFMKREIPFRKLDYELAANVRDECKIPQETEMIIQRAISNHIMYDESDAAYGYRGCDTTRFHPNPDQFCDILDDSQESDEDGLMEGVSSPVQLGSVSPASFFNKHQGYLEGETEQDYEQGYMIEDEASYSNAVSSVVFPEYAQQNQMIEIENNQETEYLQSFEGAVARRMRNLKKGNKK